MDSETHSSAPRKFALLVGVNDYPFLKGRALNGCLNDVALMRNILVRKFQFSDQPPFLTELTNAQATRDGILDAMEQLLRHVQAGDIVVFFFAGHGSQMIDREGDKASGKDQTIVPCDSGRPDAAGRAENRDIRDDEIHGWLSRLAERTEFITLIFDCCHSATAHRPLAPVRGIPARDRPADFRPRFQPAEGTRGIASAPRRGPSGWQLLSEHYAVISACRDDEYAHECQTQSGATIESDGALTFFLARALLRAKPRTTYRDVFEGVAQAVTRMFVQQHPQCEGQRERVLFGTQILVPPSFVSVKQCVLDSVFLDAGHLHGVVTGSEWNVFAKGNAEGDAPIGRIIIRKTSAVSAEADVITASSMTITESDRAVEISRPFEIKAAIQVSAIGDARHAATLVELKQRLADSPWLKLAESESAAPMRAQLLDAATAAGTSPALRASGAEPCWVVLGRDDQLCVEPQPLSNISALVSETERLVRYQRALEISPPDSLLSDKLAVQLLCRRGQSPWQAAEPDLGGHFHYQEGDAFGLRVSNLHTSALYYIVLCFGMDQSIAQLYPPPGATDQLPAGATQFLGTTAGREWRLYFPPLIARSARRGTEQHPAGVDHVQVIAANQPLDLRPLLQTGVRGGASLLARGGELEQLLAAALLGGGSRCVAVSSLPETELWTMKGCSFTVHRSAAPAK